MFTLIFVLSILFSVGLVKMRLRPEYFDLDDNVLLFVISIISNIVLFGAIVIMASELFVNSKTLGQKISMYQEENERIENQINLVVNKYQEYEKDTYEKFKDDFSEMDVVALVSMYPELKSDALIQKQIDVYVKNNESIKELKEQKIDLSHYKWFLYFGR